MTTKTLVLLTPKEAELKFFELFLKVSMLDRAKKLDQYTTALLVEGKLEPTPAQSARGITAEDVRDIYTQVHTYICIQDDQHTAWTIFQNLKDDPAELKKTIERLNGELNDGEGTETYDIVGGEREEVDA